MTDRENNTTLQERISQFIDFKGFTINKFSNLVGASNSYFNKVLKNSSSIGSDRIEKILRTFPDLNPIWLMTGSGEMILDEITEVNETMPIYGGMQIPFVSKYNIPEYLTNMESLDFWNKLPVVHWEKGTEYANFSNSKFTTFEMVGSSMNDGTYKSLLDSDILLGLEVPENQWKVSEAWTEWKYIVVHDTVSKINRVFTSDLV